MVLQTTQLPLQVLGVLEKIDLTEPSIFININMVSIKNPPAQEGLNLEPRLVYLD